jgi:predicted RNA-binding protein YlxR (DUF448 family)
MRMCMGCRSRKRKDELLRFVRSAKGSFMHGDEKDTGGRGFYLCPDPRCLKKAQRKYRVEIFEGVEVPSPVQEGFNS